MHTASSEKIPTPKGTVFFLWAKSDIKKLAQKSELKF